MTGPFLHNIFAPDPGRGLTPAKNSDPDPGRGLTPANFCDPAPGRGLTLAGFFDPAPAGVNPARAGVSRG